MPGCASEMDQHTPAFSGYIYKAPADNPSSGENSNILTWCLIAGKTQTNILSLLLQLLRLTKKCTGFSLLSIHVCQHFVTEESWQLIVKTHATCRHPFYSHIATTSISMLPCSSFKAWEWSTECSNKRTNMAADQGLSDTVNTDHFLLLSSMSQWVSHICTQLSTYKDMYTNGSTCDCTSVFVLFGFFSTHLFITLLRLFVFLFFLPCCHLRSP